jgi:hypothetical protein
MNAKRLASGIVVTGILGAALLAGIGTTATAAEAGPKRERVTQRDTRGQKVVRKDQRRSTERQRRPEAVRERRVDGKRRVQTQHGSIDVRHRRVEDRRRSVDVHRRTAPQRRPVEIRYRRHHDRRVVVRRVPTYYVPAPVHYIRPWYRTAPRFYVDRSPFYFHAGLGIYLGGVFLNLQLTDAAPAGYVFVDPYCDLEFWTVADYRRHLHRHHHRPALRLIQVEYCGY